LIHLMGGRLETHFHVFGSLAFLAFYRDWTVFIPATSVVAADHMWRGLFWPESVFGTGSVSSWRWMEHAGWVLFEDAFLIVSCRWGTREMVEIATSRARLERTHELVEAEVTERTAELREAKDQLQHSEEWFRTIVDCAGDAIITMNAAGTIGLFNRAAEEMFGRRKEQSAGTRLELLITAEGRVTFREAVQEFSHPGPEHREHSRHELEIESSDGRAVPVELNMSHTVGRRTTDVIVVLRDMTERRQVEQRLGELQRQHLESARRAGMADIATSVLHNVGNVLNSVNVSASLICDRLKRSAMTDFKRAAHLIREHLDDTADYIANDPRGRHLPRFLVELSGKMTDDEQAILDEVQNLSKGIEHIKEVVSLQQSYTGKTGFVEEVSIEALLDDAIRINAASNGRHRIDFIREFSNLPKAEIDKHKFLQIVINLLSNARNAVIESDELKRQITTRARCSEGGQLAVEVSDNGVGIAAENLTRIFSHGFTTRKAGHGFGLHSAANLAREMGGRLTVTSEGLGCGATFVLNLPLWKVGGTSCLLSPQTTSACVIES